MRLSNVKIVFLFVFSTIYFISDDVVQDHLVGLEVILLWNDDPTG
jgi:hypothetical protein